MPLFGGGRRGFGCAPRLIIALVIAGIAIFSYVRMRNVNPITGEVQHVALTPDQEVAMGLKAVPEMANQFDGFSTNGNAVRLVERIGKKLMEQVDLKDVDYKFEFHVLADKDTVNAFALPGGQIFITEALLDRLKTAGQVAGVMGHEIGHVIHRHGNQQLAKAQLAQGLSGAATVALLDPNNPSPHASAQFTQLIAGLILTKYGRDAELQSDLYAVDVVSKAGYDPRAMIQVMKILAEASGGRQGPEWASTHPTSDTRIRELEEAIAQAFPNGVPQGLIE
jgi:beta-barrel assembly-enhancing protease